MNELFEIAEFLNETHDREYTPISGISDSKVKCAEKQVFSIAIEKKNKFNKMADEIAIKMGLSCETNKRVLSLLSTNYCRYFWAKLKSPVYDESPETISIFCEIPPEGGFARYRVALDINQLHTGKMALETHNRLLEKPIPVGQLKYYLCKTKSSDMECYDIDNDKCKTLINEGTYKKVQIGSIINVDSHTDDIAITKMVENDIQLILPYYEYVASLI